MSANTVKLVSPERVKRIFECYGSDPDSWPMDEKVAALSLIQHSEELRKLQKETAIFDSLLKEADVSISTNDSTRDKLLDDVLNDLPEQESQPNLQFVNQSTENKKSFFDLNRTLGAIAASVAVVAISLSIVTITPDTIKPVSTVAKAHTELDEWMWEQVVGESADDAEEPLSMLALLELEEL